MVRSQTVKAGIKIHGMMFRTEIREIMMNSTEVMSVDPSLRSTGVYIQGKLYTIETKQKHPAEVAKKNIYNHMLSLISGAKFQIKICLIEDYSYGKAGGTKSLTALAEVRGLIQAVCFENNCRVVPVNIGMWKSVMHFKHAKKTAEDKRDYIRTADDLWQQGFSSPDEVDAYMIYKAVEKLVVFGGRTEAQKKLIEEVRRGLE